MEKYLGIELPIEKRYTYFLGGRGVLGPNVCKRAILVGDAAGFVDPLMGEGIAYAMRSAIHAVETIQECNQGGAVSSKHLMKYHESCKKEFGANFQVAEWFGLRGASFAEWLLKKAEGHEISAEILTGLARGRFGYSHLPLILLRQLPSELPSLIEKMVRSHIGA
jgi:2-polyprenyl-6-methoxyphenol hydroxylase-like FAD-dependent oxidoreductase